MATDLRAVAQALIQANQSKPAPSGTIALRPPNAPQGLTAAYNDWASGRGITDTALPREFAAFLAGQFGPLAPMRPYPIDQPDNGADRPEPRRYQYPQSWNLPHGVPGSEGLKLTSFANLRTVADTYSIARACVEVRISEILALGWDIVPTKEAEKKLRGDKKGRADWETRRAPIFKWFNKPDPNRFFSFSSWLRALLEDMLVVDAACFYLHPSRTKGKGVAGSDLAALAYIDGTTMRPLLDIHGAKPPPPNPAYAQYMYGVPRVDLLSMLTGDDIKELGGEAEARKYRSDQLLYLPYNTRSWTPYGFPPTEQALVPILSGLNRQQYQLGYYAAGSVPAVFISTGNPDSTPQQCRELQDTLNAMAGDPENRHQIIVLPGNAKIDPQRPTPLADQFDEILATQVCMAYQVQPMELGISPKTSTTQSPGASNQMAKSSGDINERKALKPTLKWVRTILDVVIQDAIGATDMRWYFEGLGDHDDDNTDVATLVNELTHGIKSIDEARILRGEQPWGLDITSKPVYFTATGIIPIDRADPASQAKDKAEAVGLPTDPKTVGEHLAHAGKQPAAPTPAHAAAGAAVAAAARAGGDGHTGSSPANAGKVEKSAPSLQSLCATLPLALRWLGDQLLAGRISSIRFVDAAVLLLRGHIRSAMQVGAGDASLGLQSSAAHTGGDVTARRSPRAGDMTVATISGDKPLTDSGDFEYLSGDTDGGDLSTTGSGGKILTKATDWGDMAGRWQLYTGTVFNAYTTAHGLVTIGGSDDPDNVVVQWHSRPGACALCRPRNDERFTIIGLPGWPGDGGFGPDATVCLGGPQCRCYLTYEQAIPGAPVQAALPLTPTTPAGQALSAARAQDERAAQLQAVQRALRARDLAELEALWDQLAYTQAEQQRPFLIGLVQDLLVAATVNAAGGVAGWGAPAGGDAADLVAEAMMAALVALAASGGVGTILGQGSAVQVDGDESRSATAPVNKGSAARTGGDSRNSGDNETAEGLEAAGIAVRAGDTGRILMLQRAITGEDDPAQGTWEFPGGRMEPGEDPFDAAKREWQEETGLKLPAGRVSTQWDAKNGVYRGYVYEVPTEDAVPIHDGRDDVTNPDDPDGDAVEALAWWEPKHVKHNPALRGELANDWKPIKRALKKNQPKIGKAMRVRLAKAAAHGYLLKARLPPGRHAQRDDGVAATFPASAGGEDDPKAATMTATSLDLSKLYFDWAARTDGEPDDDEQFHAAARDMLGLSEPPTSALNKGVRHWKDHNPDWYEHGWVLTPAGLAAMGRIAGDKTQTSADRQTARRAITRHHERAATGGPPVPGKRAARPRLSPPTGRFELAPTRGRNGDGRAPGGQWGRYGAAGLLVRSTKEKTPRFLLLKTGDWVDAHGRWQLPGGARDELENPYQAVSREAHEEIGVPEDQVRRLRPVGEHVYQPDKDWSYTTLAADADGPFDVTVDGDETTDAGWFTPAEINRMIAADQVQPTLARTLPHLIRGFPPPKRTTPRRRNLSTQQTLAAAPVGVIPGDSLTRAFGDRQVLTGPAGFMALPAGRRSSIAESMRNYQIIGFGHARLVLSGGQTHPNNVARTRKMIADIDEAMTHSPLDRNIVVYRGLASPQDVFTNWSPAGGVEGTEWVDPAYLSTTADRAMADYFSQGRSGPLGGAAAGLVRMHIRVPRGVRALRMSGAPRPKSPFGLQNWVGGDEESELLLQRGLRYRIVADYGIDAKGIRRLDVDVIP